MSVCVYYTTGVTFAFSAATMLFRFSRRPQSRHVLDRLFGVEAAERDFLRRLRLVARSLLGARSLARAWDPPSYSGALALLSTHSPPVCLPRDRASIYPLCPAMKRRRDMMMAMLLVERGAASTSQQQQQQSPSPSQRQQPSSSSSDHRHHDPSISPDALSNRLYASLRRSQDGADSSALDEPDPKRRAAPSGPAGSNGDDGAHCHSLDQQELVREGKRLWSELMATVSLLYRRLAEFELSWSAELATMYSYAPTFTSLPSSSARWLIVAWTTYHADWCFVSSGSCGTMPSASSACGT